MVSRLPNVLTAARLVAVVPFAVLLAKSDDGVSIAAAVIFALASITDFLDGYIARHAHAQSRFGVVVDPIADRLLIDVALILLVYHHRLEWWLALPVLLRDVILAGLFRIRHVGTHVRVNYVGKCGTAAIMAGLGLMMVTSNDWPKLIYVFGMGLSVAAGWMYLRAPEQQQGGVVSRPS